METILPLSNIPIVVKAKVQLFQCNWNNIILSAKYGVEWHFPY